MLGPRPLPEAVFILQSVTEAVGYIHRHGIVHRDIKSDNIKISATGQVKLLDFGIAKVDSTPSLTQTGHVVGTLQYLAPEALKGGTADARSDVWALGVLLYESLTGKVPFEATTIGDLYEKISRAAYPSPSSLNQLVPRAAEAIIARCLKKNPADRYPSAQELQQDVAHLAAKISASRLNVLVDSNGAAPVTGTRRWIREHGLTLAAVLGLALAVLSFLVVSYSFLVRSLGVRTSVGSAVASTAAAPTSPAPPAGTVLALDPELPASRPVKEKPVQPAPARSPARSKERRDSAPSRIIRVEVDVNGVGGPADVYRHGQRVNSTPYRFMAYPGEPIDLLLRRNGFVDKPVRFSVENRDEKYTYKMDPKE